MWADLIVETRQYIELIRSRGEEADAKRDIPGYRARRWAIEQAKRDQKSKRIRPAW